MPCLPGFCPVMNVAHAVDETLGMLVSICASAPSPATARRLGSSPAANCRCRYDHGSPSSPSTTTRGFREARRKSLTAGRPASSSTPRCRAARCRRRPAGSQVAEVAQALLDLLLLLVGVDVGVGRGVGGAGAGVLGGVLRRVVGSVGHRAITSPRMPSGTG